MKLLIILLLIATSPLWIWGAALYWLITTILGPIEDIELYHRKDKGWDE